MVLPESVSQESPPWVREGHQSGSAVVSNLTYGGPIGDRATSERLTMRKPSPSFIVASAALLVALGGTGYAAGMIGSADIRDNTIKSKDVKDGALQAVDFKAGQLPAGEQGPQGPQGIPGTPGAPGTPGTNGTNGKDGIGRWLLVDRNGAIVAQSGGFTIRTAYDIVNNSGAAVPGGAIGNVYIDANEPLDDNGIVVSIALQNQYEQNNNANVNGRAAGPDVNPEFSGEITATMCGIASVVACAPNGANTINTFVVSPRMSDGSVTVTGDPMGVDLTMPNTHKRFYVILTGDSSDYVPLP